MINHEIKCRNKNNNVTNAVLAFVLTARKSLRCVRRYHGNC